MRKTAMIIINYNSAEETKTYINEIKDYAVINKIVIVDNASTDDSLEVLKKLESSKVSIVESKQNLGYAKGNNLGIKALGQDFEYIIISNPDISIEERAIRACINELEKNPKAALVAPRIYVDGKPDKRSAWKERTFGIDIINSIGILQILFAYKHKKSQYNVEYFEKNITEVDCVLGAFLVIRYDVLRQVCFFDESTFLYYEEDILCKKIRELGYKVYSINNEKCIHYNSKIVDRTYSVFKKKNILNASRKYYHYKYNKIPKWKLRVFDLCNFFRKVELIIEHIIIKIIR